MRTLLQTPYLRGSPFIILLTVLFAAMDEVRGRYEINLGRLPQWFKLLYIRVLVFQFDDIDDAGWRLRRREPVLQWIRNRIVFKAEKHYYRLWVTWYNYKRLGRWAYMPVAGGITRAGPISALFFDKQHGGLPFIRDASIFTGNIFFVDTGTAVGGTTSGFGHHPDQAVTDIDSAHDLCTATQGDTIFALPGHTDTISAAAGISFDVAGITLIGQGHGAARPTVTFSATGSTWVISGASAVIENIIVTCTAATTKLFDSSAAWTRLHKVDYVEGSAIPLQFILTTSGSDDLEITGCRHNAKTAGASAQLWIRLIGNDSPNISDNIFTMTLENGATDAVISGDASVRSFIVARNLIVQLGGTTQVSCILFTNGATGLASYNGCAVGSTGLPGIVDVGTSGYAVENYALNTTDVSGLLDPVADS